MTRTVDSMMPEVMPSNEVPDLWHYAIRKKCQECKVPPMTACRAPLVSRTANDRGLDPQDPRRLHYRRVATGRRHRLWDLSVGAPEAFNMLSAGVA